MGAMKNVMLALIGKKARQLRHPTLFFMTAGLFLLDLFIPDIIPLVDELLLGLATIWLGNIFKKKPSKKPKAAPPR